VVNDPVRIELEYEGCVFLHHAEVDAAATLFLEPADQLTFWEPLEAKHVVDVIQEDESLRVKKMVQIVLTAQQKVTIVCHAPKPMLVAGVEANGVRAGVEFRHDKVLSYRKT
jgi:hypothetical protein